MQQMNSQEGKQQNSYGQYEGITQNDLYNEPYGVGQKLDNDDEQFADVIVRRMKQEFGDDVSKNAQRTLSARMTVAIVSLCALLPLFALLVLALVFGHVSNGGDIALGYGFFFIIAAIIAINGSFNRIGSVVSKRENTKSVK